jgi:hypothetical protein
MSDKEGGFTAKDAKSAKDNYYLKMIPSRS